jgi:protein-disulfide isomerase
VIGAADGPSETTPSRPPARRPTLKVKLPMRLVPLAIALISFATTAVPLDLDNLTDDERAALGSEIRSYLLENPDILQELVDALEAKQAAEQADADSALIAANADAIFADGYSFVGGNPDGSLTVVEFIDYKCSYCRKAHADVSELVATDTDIRYIIKEFPILGEQSLLASQFAMATLNIEGPEAYRKVNAGFYEGFRGDVTPETLSAFATDLGLDPAPILAEMDSPDIARKIEENHLLAQRLQVSGTPTFVIGDQVLRGFAPLDIMRDIVAQERS